MKSLFVTYTNESSDRFDYVKDLNRFNDILSFTYTVKTKVFERTIDCRIRMEEVRKFEVWEDNVD